MGKTKRRWRISLIKKSVFFFLSDSCVFSLAYIFLVDWDWFIDIKNYKRALPPGEGILSPGFLVYFVTSLYFNRVKKEVFFLNLFLEHEILIHAFRSPSKSSSWLVLCKSLSLLFGSPLLVSFPRALFFLELFLLVSFSSYLLFKPWRIHGKQSFSKSASCAVRFL